MTNTKNLAQLQACFAQQLLLMPAEAGSDHELAVNFSPLANLLAPSQFTPAQLINLYRNNFIISLKQLLEQLFPVTQALVGRDYFIQTSGQFIHQCALKEAHLNHYGSQFVTFLEQLNALEAMPFIAQMAAMEWHLDRISHIFHEPHFDFNGLAQVAADNYLNIQFNLASSCQLLTSNMNLIALHSDLSVTTADAIELTNEAHYQQVSYILVLQNQNGESALMPLSLQHWRWLTGLKNNLSLAQLCAIEQTDLTTLMMQITDWIALGCIDSFSLTTN
jgi:hypothetical protein